jgi:thioesterase domain-containing protein
MMLSTPLYDADYLQGRIDREFALAKHMGIIVESADDTGVVLRAPLALNANYKGTAFGGSLYSVAVLAGWAWVTRFLTLRAVAADGVIQESNIRYLLPVHGEMRAVAIAPDVAQRERFLKMLARSGRGRLDLTVETYYGQQLATVLEGAYVAAMRA